MLGYLERLSLQCGGTKVFVLSTQTMEWFVERGFKEVPVEVSSEKYDAFVAFHVRDHTFYRNSDNVALLLTELATK
jgi:N-acetylglutamate synthase-like GNAT family acetyltransferase